MLAASPTIEDDASVTVPERRNHAGRQHTPTLAQAKSEVNRVQNAFFFHRSVDKLFSETYNTCMDIATQQLAAAEEAFEAREITRRELQECEAEAHDNRNVTVCAACLRASCWHGVFLCDQSQTASTIRVSRTMLNKLGREHPDNYSDARLDEMGAY